MLEEHFRNNPVTSCQPYYRASTRVMTTHHSHTDAGNSWAVLADHDTPAVPDDVSIWERVARPNGLQLRSANWETKAKHAMLDVQNSSQLHRLAAEEVTKICSL